MKHLPHPLDDLVAVVDSIPAAITLFDLDGRILYANQRALRALGYRSDEVVGRGMELFFRDSLAPPEVLRIKEAARDRGWRGEVLNYRKDGGSFPVYLETGVVRGDDGLPLAVVAVVFAGKRMPVKVVALTNERTT